MFVLPAAFSFFVFVLSCLLRLEGEKLEYNVIVEDFAKHPENTKYAMYVFSIHRQVRNSYNSTLRF